MSNALKSNSLATLSNKRLQHLPTIVRGVSGHMESTSAESDETRSVVSSCAAAEGVSKRSNPETSGSASWNHRFRDFDERKDAMSFVSSNHEYASVTHGQDYFTDNQQVC